jgi:predicted DCC family thiol-disulfide oxidoreductase YuxK
MSETRDAQQACALTVYYDGDCPLCRMEIAHYQKQEGAERIAFVDAAQAPEKLAEDLTRKDALARFHVRDANGALVSGAAAFARIWRVLPRWRWAARLASLPGILWVMERAYRAFLPLRPFMARAMRASSRRRPPTPPAA